MIRMRYAIGTALLVMMAPTGKRDFRAVRVNIRRQLEYRELRA